MVRLANWTSRNRLLAVLVLALIGRSVGAVEPVVVQGRQVYIGGERFIMRGMCYSPTPYGRQNSSPPHGDYFTREWREIYQRDLPRMRELGVNCVRVYGWAPEADHTEFLNLAWNGGQQPIRVFISNWIDPYTDWRSTRAVGRLRNDWGRIADRARDHPAVLGYLVGNELNQAGWNRSLPSLWTALNEVAGTIREHDPHHLISSALSDADLTPELRSAVKQATNMNAWCVQTYRGDSFKALFIECSGVNDKPLFVSEFGLDAYDGGRRREFPDDARVQAQWIEALWKEIEANPSIVSGGAVFAWSDEWGRLGRATRQDPGGWHNGAFPDGQANEEWWGIHRIPRGKPDKLEPRAAVETLRRLWAPDRQREMIKSHGDR